VVEMMLCLERAGLRDDHAMQPAPSFEGLTNEVGDARHGPA